MLKETPHAWGVLSTHTASEDHTIYSIVHLSFLSRTVIHKHIVTAANTEKNTTPFCVMQARRIESKKSISYAQPHRTLAYTPLRQHWQQNCMSSSTYERFFR